MSGTAEKALRTRLAVNGVASAASQEMKKQGLLQVERARPGCRRASTGAPRALRKF